MESKPCIFVLYCLEHNEVIIAVCVDDLLIAYKLDKFREGTILFSQKKNDFKMKNFGEPKEMF
jgi:hypothetical protein